MKTATKYSLRTWVMVLALAPTILIGTVLAVYFTSNRFTELENTLLRQGTNLIAPLAIAAEYGLQYNNREHTKRLVDTLHQQNAGLVQTITVFNAEHQAFVSSNYNHDFELLKLTDSHQLPQGIDIESFGDTVVMRTPILSNVSLYGNALTDAEPLGYLAVQLNKHQALLTQYRSGVAAFIIVLIGVQLNLLFTFRLLKNVTQPITAMVSAVAKIREGKLDTRLNGDLIGELDDLKRGINAMAASLAEYHNEMQQNIDQATLDLRETLEQIEIQNVELDIAKKRALEASRIKSEFLANMSHELRTPLNGVIGFARQLLKTPLHDNQRDYMQTIERSAGNLLSIINDILDFSKLEAGKMVLDKIPFALRDTVDETVQLLVGAANDKALELVVDIDPAIPDSLNGDAMRVQQILTNLIGNAIKFTEQGSVKVCLELADEPGDNILLRGEVSDTGIGIPEQQKAKLFQAFGQADSSITRRFGGTGLGLVITKRLVNQMDGQIGFSSQRQQGSTFWFTLSIEKGLFQLSDDLGIDQLAKQRVLVVEPRRNTRQSLERLLQSWQMEVDLYSDLNQCQPHPEGYQHALLSASLLTDPNQVTTLIEQLQIDNPLIVTLGKASHWQLELCHNSPRLNVLPLPLSQRSLSQALNLKPLSQPLLSHAAPAALPAPSISQPSRDKLPLRVLAVDDNPANLKLIATLLGEMVEQVDLAGGGRDALALCKQAPYDAIFMDIQMPDMDGLHTTELVRADSQNRHCPIIAVTAHMLGQEREEILAVGMDDYLTKPIDEQALRERLTRWAKPNNHASNDSIDWPLALSQAGGNSTLAKEMLGLLIESLPETQRGLDQAILMGDNAALQQGIHKLHGATCYSGVPALQKLCAELETSLKKGASINDLEPELLELQDQLNQVTTAAKAYLAA
ncbi:two-component sensor histidine kinase BarA [uncultured Ferrimonas sp.]|uniref:two-component sensor histidine kinase BarA n=1 Tax=uncultured Ferrimonas sp. TaxID=432640 RepID=UPI00262E1999|nr:two-component sensor histidine kinase BarA [uncultured Ferrimonas sp.]